MPKFYALVMQESKNIYLFKLVLEFFCLLVQQPWYHMNMDCD